MTLCLPFFLKKKKTKQHLGFWSIASGKAICHCKISSSCLSELEQFFHEMLHCVVTSVLKGGKSKEMLIFLKEVCCLYSANSWRMSVFSLYCHPFKSEAWKVWFWFLNSLPHHLGQIACNNVRICGKRILVTTCFLQHLFFFFFFKRCKIFSLCSKGWRALSIQKAYNKLLCVQPEISFGI